MNPKEDQNMSEEEFKRSNEGQKNKKEDKASFEIQGMAAFAFFAILVSMFFVNSYLVFQINENLNRFQNTTTNMLMMLISDNHYRNHTAEIELKTTEVQVK